MPAYHALIPRVIMAVPAVSNTHPKHHTGRKGHCSRLCTIALATIFPIILLALIATIAFLAWGKPYLAQRRQQRMEREAAEKKLGDEESVAESDVSSLDGDVHRLNEEGRHGARAIRGDEERRDMRREEGHEHDHVLAMIGARL
ncbi:MAG: hypothetical protein LQ339_002366 [Xanthoria mediterranea]|nr:MAG: hypothetical protein LQ339_002366 [Xanthoria mediterranea]